MAERKREREEEGAKQIASTEILSLISLTPRKNLKCLQCVNSAYCCKFTGYTVLELRIEGELENAKLHSSNPNTQLTHHPHHQTQLSLSLSLPINRSSKRRTAERAARILFSTSERRTKLTHSIH